MAKPDLQVLMLGTALDARGGVASVLCTLRDAGLFELCGVHYVATNGPGGSMRKLLLASSAFIKAAWLMTGGRAKIVHIHTSSFTSFWRKTPFLALALALNKKLIISLHGGAFKEFYAGRGPLAQAWIRLVLRRSRRFIVLTQSWRDWAEQIEPLARVIVIPNAVKIPSTPLVAESSEPDLLLFLGRIEAEKGLEVLLQALVKAHSQGAHWRLACGGSGNIEAMQILAKTLGLHIDAVQFLGWLDDTDKQAWLQRCSLLVLPSLIENMPVSVLEAFAAGKPVIATRVGGLPDMVHPEIDGWLVEAGNSDDLAAALVGAFSQTSQLSRMGNNAQQKARAKYSSHFVVDLLSKVFDEVGADNINGSI